MTNTSLFAKDLTWTGLAGLGPAQIGLAWLGPLGLAQRCGAKPGKSASPHVSVLPGPLPPRPDVARLVLLKE